MPRRTACRCGGVRIGGKCERCDRTLQSKQSSSKRGYNAKWQEYSQSFRRSWPFCSDHQRDGVLVSIHPEDGSKQGAVDHIVRPKTPDDPLFWDTTNHLGRCTSCHSKKTILEESGNYCPRADQKYRIEQLIGKKND